MVDGSPGRVADRARGGGAASLGPARDRAGPLPGSRHPRIVELLEQRVLLVAPTLTPPTGAPAYTENQAATAIDPTLTVADSDSTNLAGATVAITGGFAGGQDELGFVDQLGIAGSLNAAGDVLTLTGSATVANYETALLGDVSQRERGPEHEPCTVTFTVDDGGPSDNTGTTMRTISVTDANDKPVVNLPVRGEPTRAWR